MGADYTIENKGNNKEESSFYITRNYNEMFPFWMLHDHIEEPYNKKENFDIKGEYNFLLKTIRKTLQYYMKGNIYNHKYWDIKSKQLPEHYEPNGKGWETNKYTIIMAFIRYYWHLKRYPFDKYKWGCWY